MSNNSPLPPEKDQLYCHRLQIPVPVYEQSPTGRTTKDANGNLAMEMSIVPKGTIFFVPCHKAKCAIWDSKKLQCGDVSKRQALETIADIMLEQHHETKISEVHG